MWISCSISLPLEVGKYKTLIEIDEWGTLQKSDNNHFDGKDWSHTDSNRQFIKYWWGSTEQYKIITNSLDNKRDKELEDQAIIKYIKSQHDIHIVVIYGDYIIMAHDINDLQSKKASIDRGQNLGFYVRQRILDIINNQPVQVDWSGFPQSTQDAIKQQSREKFLTKWFDSEKYPISERDHKFTKVTVLIPDPHIQDKIATQQFLEEMKQVGFKSTITYGYEERPNPKSIHSPWIKTRNYSDFITFELI